MPEITELIELAEASASGTDEELVNSEFALRVKRLRGQSSASEQDCVRQVYTELLAKNRPRIDALPYPDNAKALVQQEFDRIQNAVNEEPGDYFSLASHGCRCDARILCFGRIPVGPEHLEVDGLPRSLLWKGGIQQAIKCCQLIARAGGVKPFYAIHLAYGIDPTTFLLTYSKRAQKKMFLTIAECLRMHPKVKGLLAGSWWHDPKVEEIASHLAYLRTGWTDNGAELFFWEQSDDITDVATRNSPTRREQFERGEYTPKCYMAVWTRESLLRWADTQDVSKKRSK